MPIYEYYCQDCQYRFERLMLQAGATPTCDRCGGDKLEKQLSVFAVGTRTATSSAMPSPCGACGDPRGPGACSLN
jgi:putative FmdB family regulatory protein